MNFIQPLSSSSLLNSPKPTQSPKQTSSVSNVNRQLKHEFPRLFKSSTVDDFNLFQKTSKSRKISLSTQNILSYPFISSQDLDHYTSSIKYSARYNDDQFQYRHVTIPPFLYDHLDSKFKNRLLDELEWRSMGITMSEGWMHYELSAREPHIFLFKRYIDDIDDVSDELFPLGLEEVKSPSRRSSLAIGKKRSSLAMEEKIKAKDVRYSLRRQKNL